MVAQFGELSFSSSRPHQALRDDRPGRVPELGIKDPGEHMIVSAYLTHSSGDLSTII